jgi:hypothetical protein
MSKSKEAISWVDNIWALHERKTKYVPMWGPDVCVSFGLDANGLLVMYSSTIKNLSTRPW